MWVPDTDDSQAAWKGPHECWGPAAGCCFWFPQSCSSFSSSQLMRFWPYPSNNSGVLQTFLRCEISFHCLVTQISWLFCPSYCPPPPTGISGVRETRLSHNPPDRSGGSSSGIPKMPSALFLPLGCRVCFYLEYYQIHPSPFSLHHPFVNSTARSLILSRSTKYLYCFVPCLCQPLTCILGYFWVFQPDAGHCMY